MCAAHAEPRGIISQHPACHRLQQGGRAGEVTVGGDGGRSLVGLINQEKEVFPLEQRSGLPIDIAGSWESLAL